MENEDYLGITALALATLAEQVVDSINSEDVRPVLMEHIMNAALKWGVDENSVKQEFLTNVKNSIDQVQNWREKYSHQVGCDSN